MENDGRGKQVAEIQDLIPSDRDIERKLEAELSIFADTIDSPRVLLILRNAALTLLEVHGSIGLERMFLLVADSEYRAGIVDHLVTETPKYWDDTWNAAWAKDSEPLYSKRQQAIARRISLITFWIKEWSELPKHEVEHTSKALQALAR